MVVALLLCISLSKLVIWQYQTMLFTDPSENECEGQTTGSVINTK